MTGGRELPRTAARRRAALLALRVSLGLLLVVWGADKLRDATHGLQVIAGFYGGVTSSRALVTGFGAAEVAVGAAIVLGVWRRVGYPFLALVTGSTLVAVWRSVVDPLGVVLEGTELLFYPSLIIFAATLVLWAFRDDDTICLDRRVRPQPERALPLPP